MHVDVGYYDDASMLNGLALDRMRAAPATDGATPSRLTRLSIELESDADVRATRLDGPAAGDFCEFPVVDPRLAGRRHRFVYAVGLKRPGNVGNLLTRTDCDTGETIANGFGAVVVGEALVVPRPGVPDDYVVMVVVHDAAGDALVASPTLEEARGRSAAALLRLDSGGSARARRRRCRPRAMFNNVARQTDAPRRFFSRDDATKTAAASRSLRLHAIASRAEECFTSRALASGAPRAFSLASTRVVAQAGRIFSSSGARIRAACFSLSSAGTGDADSRMRCDRLGAACSAIGRV